MSSMSLNAHQCLRVTTLLISDITLAAQMVKNLPVMRETLTVMGRSPGEGNGNPLQYSCLENSMDRGAWHAIVHGVAKEPDTTE